MAKFIFSRDYDYKPQPSVTIAYKAGPNIVTVRKECAERAAAGGYGEWVDRKEPEKVEDGGE